MFFKEYEKEKYENILKISELEQDIKILSGGDLTEIGEKGINLSGGQKARVSIARALYSDNDIYLFDDPISVLDSNVGKNIITNCLRDYLKNKTRILVTHAVQYASHADRIIYLKDGAIEWEGTFSELQKQDFYIKLNLQHASKEENEKNKKNKEAEIIKQLIQEKKRSSTIKRVTKDEDKEEGGLKGNVYLTYTRNNGGWTFLILLYFPSTMAILEMWK